MAANGTPLRGGDLNAAITSALVGIQREHLGRGPASATTLHKDKVVITLMHDVMTPAERSFAGTAHEGTIAHTRHLLQKTMEKDFTDAVERLTGAKVTSFASTNSVDPDLATEIFILDTVLAPSA